MRNETYSREGGSLQILNLSTNILTIVLFIAYSIVKRIVSPDWVIYLLFISFLACMLLSLYALYLNTRGKAISYKINNAWLIIRVVANLGFAILTFLLLK